MRYGYLRELPRCRGFSPGFSSCPERGKGDHRYLRERQRPCLFVPLSLARALLRVGGRPSPGDGHPETRKTHPRHSPEIQKGMAKGVRKARKGRARRLAPGSAGSRPPDCPPLREYAALAQADRLAALGDLSARLAHRLRSPLSGVLLSLANLRAELKGEEPVERLGLAIAELERIGHLLAAFVEGFRPPPEPPRRLALARTIEGLAGLAARALDPPPTLVCEVPADLVCRLPERELKLALLHLIRNATQAMAGRPGTVRIRAVRRGALVELSVCDQGPGFPEGLVGPIPQERGVAGGAGLGLALVRRFAATSSGRLLLSNLPEGGACATIAFPPEAPDVG